MKSNPKLEFIGHATFVVTATDGTTLIVDPYPADALDGALGLEPIEERYDFAVSSHDHVDHAGAASLPGPPQLVVRGRIGPFTIERIESDHDEWGGEKRGGQVDLLRIVVDGFSIVHAADIGRTPSERALRAIEKTDLLIVPVGGFFTVGASQGWEWCLRSSPRAVVPMHYRVAGSTLPIRDLVPFRAATTWPWEKVTGILELQRLGTLKTIYEMEPRQRGCIP